MMDDPEFLEYVRVRLNTMAAAIYAAYGELAGYPTDWDATDGTISEETRTRYLVIADDVLDKIEWRRFGLVDGASTAREIGRGR